MEQHLPAAHATLHRSELPVADASADAATNDDAATNADALRGRRELSDADPLHCHSQLPYTNAAMHKHSYLPDAVADSDGNALRSRF